MFRTLLGLLLAPSLAFAGSIDVYNPENNAANLQGTTANQVLTGNGTSGISSNSNATLTSTGLTLTSPVVISTAGNNGQFLTNAPLLISGTTNTFLQVGLQNLSNGVAATSDFVLTTDLGGNTSYYADFFINSSKYSQAAYSVETSSDAGFASSDSNLFLWADINGGLNNGSGHVILGSSNPVSGNKAVDVSSSTVSIVPQLKLTNGPILGGTTISTVTSCGNNTTFVGNGTMSQVTVGSSPGTTCSITWSSAFPTGSMGMAYDISRSTGVPSMAFGVKSATATFPSGLTAADVIQFIIFGY